MDLGKIVFVLFCILGLSIGNNINLFIWTEATGANHETQPCKRTPFAVAAVKHIAFDAPYGSHDARCFCFLYPATLLQDDMLDVSLDVTFHTDFRNYPAIYWASGRTGFPEFDLRADQLHIALPNETLSGYHDIHESEIRINNGSDTILTCASSQSAALPPTPAPTDPETTPPTVSDVTKTDNCSCFCQWVICYVIICVAIAIVFIGIVAVVIVCVRRRRRSKMAELEGARRGVIDPREAEVELCAGSSYVEMGERRGSTVGNHYEPIMQR